MKRLIDLLAPLGLLVIIGAQMWSRAGKTLPGKPEYFWIAGGALVLLNVLLRGPAIAAAIGRRQLRYGGNTFVLVAVVIAILAAVNWIVYRNTKRWDLTQNQRYSLSDQTKKVVSGLKDDVKITYFQRSAALAQGQDRLKEYQALSPRLKVEYVDPIQHPGKAQEFDAKGPWPILIVERSGQRERISNDSEQDLTNALIKVTREGRKTICFAAGEGERDMDDSGDRGFSGAKAALGRNQYEAKKVVLLQEKSVPKECTVLLVPAPEKDLLAPVVDAIRAYVKAGGKAFVMAEPELDGGTPNLTALLKEWKVDSRADVVVDVSGIGQLFGTGPLTPIVAQYPYHEITKDFRVMTAFHTARSLQAGTGDVEGVFAQNLLETSAQSWAESDLKLREPIEMNADKDQRGPVALGVALTVRPPSPSASPSAETEGEEEKKDDKPKVEGRVVAVGDADFASNALLGFQGNQDFFLNAVAWLAEDVDLISIRPREPEDQRLGLTQGQAQNVTLFALLLLPGIFVVMGVATWWRRR